jgi:hypothetical protein
MLEKISNLPLKEQFKVKTAMGYMGILVDETLRKINNNLSYTGRLETIPE